MSINTTYCKICQQYVNHTAIYKHCQSKKHRENVENQQQSNILKPENLNKRITGPVLDSSIPLDLPPPLIPVPASKVYKKLDKKRIETFARKLNKRLENNFNSRKLLKSFTPIYDRISKQILRKNKSNLLLDDDRRLIHSSLFDFPNINITRRDAVGVTEVNFH